MMPDSNPDKDTACRAVHSLRMYGYRTTNRNWKLITSRHQVSANASTKQATGALRGTHVRIR
jgi:hypothetical protein